MILDRRQNRPAFHKRILHFFGKNILISCSVNRDFRRFRIPQIFNYPTISAANIPTVDSLNKNFAVIGFNGNGKRNISADL